MYYIFHIYHDVRCHLKLHPRQLPSSAWRIWKGHGDHLNWSNNDVGVLRNILLWSVTTCMSSLFSDCLSWSFFVLFFVVLALHFVCDQVCSMIVHIHIICVCLSAIFVLFHVHVYVLKMNMSRWMFCIAINEIRKKNKGILIGAHFHIVIKIS